MLVLSRKIGETIVANGVTFRILGMQGGRVRVGVVAPPEVAIKRGEVADKDAGMVADASDEQGVGKAR